MTIDKITYPRASLSGLPIELKTEIVKLAHRQDVAFAARLKGTNFEPHEVDPPPSTMESKLLWAGFGRRHGKSINALFQTNKEFSELAAVHLYHTVTSRGASAPIFRFALLARRASLIRSLHFKSSAGPYGNVVDNDIIDTIYSFHALTNLHELRLHSGITSFVDSRSPLDVYSKSNPTDYAFAAFCRTAAVVDTLTLTGIDPFYVSELLEIFPNLRHLVLDGRTARGWDQDLGLKVAALSKLESLALENESDISYRFRVRKSWFGDEWKSPSTMKRLALRVDKVDEDTMDFIRLFSSSLETLDILYASFDPSYLDTTNEGTPLPRLTTLSICTRTHTNAVRMLSILGPSPLVDLKLELVDTENPMLPDLAKTSILPLLDDIPSLRQLCVGESKVDPGGIPGPWLTHAATSLIRQYCDEHAIVFVRQDHDDVLQTFVEDEPVRQGDFRMANVCAELRDVLEYGTARLEAVERMGDVAGASELVMVLEKLHARRGIERH